MKLTVLLKTGIRISGLALPVRGLFIITHIPGNFLALN